MWPSPRWSHDGLRDVYSMRSVVASLLRLDELFGLRELASAQITPLAAFAPARRWPLREPTPAGFGDPPDSPLPRAFRPLEGDARWLRYRPIGDMRFHRENR